MQAAQQRGVRRRVAVFIVVNEVILMRMRRIEFGVCLVLLVVRMTDARFILHEQRYSGVLEQQFVCTVVRASARKHIVRMMMVMMNEQRHLLHTDTGLMMNRIEMIPVCLTLNTVMVRRSVIRTKKIITVKIVYWDTYIGKIFIFFL